MVVAGEDEVVTRLDAKLVSEVGRDYDPACRIDAEREEKISWDSLINCHLQLISAITP